MKLIFFSRFQALAQHLESVRTLWDHSSALVHRVSSCFLMATRVPVSEQYQTSIIELLNILFSDTNECAADANLCEDGDCINTDGGFKCECPPGYVLSPDGKKCVDVREELCFNTFRRGTCLDPRMTPLTRTQCCCTMGAAWGNGCDKCPLEGTRKKDCYLPKELLKSFFLLQRILINSAPVVSDAVLKEKI